MRHISLDRHHDSQDLELHFSSVKELKDWSGSLRDIMSARVNLDEVPRDYGICKTKPIMQWRLISVYFSYNMRGGISTRWSSTR